MSQNIVLTTGIYDLIKEHIRRKKATAAEEEVLKEQLKNATQVPRKDLPSDVVSVDTVVTVKDLATNEEEVYKFVAPAKAKARNQTLSIVDQMGLALVGYTVGAKIEWPLEGEEFKKMEILKVESLN
ncbi:MAG: GreA/GreB family elongation factor [Flavobacterium sp.]